MELPNIAAGNATNVHILWTPMNCGIANLGMALYRELDYRDDRDTCPLIADLERLGIKFPEYSSIFRVGFPDPRADRVIKLTGAAATFDLRLMGYGRNVVYWLDDENIYVVDHDGRLLYSTFGSGVKWETRFVLAHRIDDDERQYGERISIHASSELGSIIVEIGTWGTPEEEVDGKVAVTMHAKHRSMLTATQLETVAWMKRIIAEGKMLPRNA